MKDIIAALEAKRAAARAGGGEKRHAAQHTKAKLTASIVLGALLLSTACSQPAASPQAPAVANADWTDESGRISLSYVARAWRPISPLRNATDVLEIASPNDREGRIRMCSILEPGRGALLHGSQAEINADMRSRTVAADVPQQWSGAPDFQFAHTTVDGIAVIDMSFSSGTMYQRWRTFRLPGSIGSAQYQLACGATLPITDDERAEIEAIVTSLHFTPER